MTEQEKYYLDDLILKALTVSTDEVEGLQVIDLNNLNLCAVDYAKTDVDYNYYTPDPSLRDTDIVNKIYSDSNLLKLIITPPEELPEILEDINTDDRVIIEFADATVKDPNPVTYSIKVNPGDLINDDTIMGQVMQDGKMKTIKSIFSKGTVCGINDNTEYFTLYPSKCTRHIVLENTLSGIGSEFDISLDISALCDKFKNEGMLFALITNNLCQSLLPYVLSRRYRGVYTRSKYTSLIGVTTYGKWKLDTSDLSYDNTEVSTFVQDSKFSGGVRYDTPYFVFDTENESLNTGVTIFDTSIMGNLDEYQDDFGSQIIGADITKAELRSWKRRAKKKRRRKAVKREINAKAEASVNKIKYAESPYQAILDESKRLLGARSNYIDNIIALYRNKDKLPLCKFDPEYTDCKFLVNDTIDKNVLKNVLKFDSEFSYSAIGDVDNYYNYYFSLLGNINLVTSESDPWTMEFYNIITDIINKRVIVEGLDALSMKKYFLKLFNDNVSNIFPLYSNEKLNTEEYVNRLFVKFENIVQTFVRLKMDEHNKSIKQQYTDAGLDDEAIGNAGQIYTADNKYQLIYDYINSVYTFADDEDSDCPNEIASLLASMYNYINSYGNGDNNPYKDLEIDGKYIYLSLVQEEAKKICDFWDRVIDAYLNSTMDNCILDLSTLAHSFDEYATWPVPTEITINNVTYKHYLFENIYPKEFDDTVDISIGDYSFPDHVDFPDIPDEWPVDEDWAIDEMNKHEMLEPDNPNAISFLDFKYWQKYFSLATLICLVPSFWNCGLDIFPFILLIPLPCIFIAFTSVYIPMFNLLMVFGIAIRGMYPWPIILYLNTSNQPISVLTPLVAVLERLRDVFYGKLNQIEQVPTQQLANMYIKKLNDEINELKKENIKLETYKTVIKSMKVPKAESVKETFAQIVDPSIDTRQRIRRLETLARKQRVR